MNNTLSNTELLEAIKTTWTMLNAIVEHTPLHQELTEHFKQLLVQQRARAMPEKVEQFFNVTPEALAKEFQHLREDPWAKG